MIEAFIIVVYFKFLKRNLKGYGVIGLNGYWLLVRQDAFRGVREEVCQHLYCVLSSSSRPQG